MRANSKLLVYSELRPPVVAQEGDSPMKTKMSQ
jgi:hypothetical protein